MANRFDINTKSQNRFDDLEDENAPNVINFAKDVISGPDYTTGAIARNTVLGLPKATLEVGKGILQGIARNAVSAGMSFGNALNKVLGKDITTTYDPESPIAKKVLGEETIKDLATRVYEAEETLKTSQLSKKLGLSKQPTIFAIGAVTGSVALDLTPFGMEKNVIKTLTKTKTANDAFKVLTSMKVEKEIAAKFSSQFANTNTDKSTKELFEIMKSYIGTKNAAKNTDISFDVLSDNVQKELYNLDTTPLLVNGKLDLTGSDESFRLMQLQDKVKRDKLLTKSEIMEAIPLLKKSGADPLDIPSKQVIKPIGVQPRDSIGRFDKKVSGRPTLSKPPVEAYGGVAGVEVNKDENGKETIGFNPMKAAFGVAGMTAIKGAKNTKIVSEVDKLISEGLIRVVSKSGRDVYQYIKNGIWKNAPNEMTAVERITNEATQKAATTLPPELEEKVIGLQIAKEAMENDPMNELVKYVGRRGEFKGQLPEVTGTGQGGVWARRGDDIVTERLGNVDTETARAKMEDFLKAKDELLQTEKSVKEELAAFKAQQKNLKFSSEGVPLALNKRQAAIAAQSDQLPSYAGGTGEVRSVEKAAEVSQQLAQERTQIELPSLQKIVTQSTPLRNKVGILDYLKSPEKVLAKIGLDDEAKLLRTQYEKYLKELPENIDKITKWSKSVSPESNVRIFRFLDNENVDLTREELDVAYQIKGWLANWADRLGLPQDNRISNYITHIFDDQLIKKEFDEDLAKIIADKIPGSVYDPFLQKRLGAKGYIQDTWAALDAYVKRATRKVHMDPALERIEGAASSLEESQFDYVKSYIDRVNMRPTKIDNRIDNTIKQAFGYKFGQRPIANISTVLRRITFRGMIGGNLGSAMRNLSQGVNTYAKLGEKYTPLGYIKLATQGFDELKQVGVLADNFVQDRLLSSTKQKMQKLDKALFAFFDTAEKINRGAAYYGAKAKAIAKGMSEADAVEYAKQLVRETQFNYSSIDTPVALNSDISKLFLQFLTYPVKQTEFIANMAKNKEFMGLARYALGGLGFVYTIGELFDMSPSELIPWSNFISGESKFGIPPSLKLPTEIFKAAVGTNDKYGRERDLEKKVTDIYRAATGVVPGGVQLRKTMEGVKAILEEGVYDKNDKKMFDVGGTFSSDLQAALFGKYVNPNAQEYFDKMSGKSKKKTSNRFDSGGSNRFDSWSTSKTTTRGRI